MSSSRKTLPAPHWHRIVAMVVVLGVHGLLLQALLGPARALIEADPDRLRVRWLPRPSPPALPVPRLPRQPPIAGARAAPALPALPPAAQAQAQPEPLPGAAALDLRLPGDAVGAEGLDSATFAPRLIGRREQHAAFAPPPGRFRMKRELTPEQLVQGIAQALQMWPPGYSVDPCRLSTAQVDYFQNAVDERDRDLLRAALISQRQDC